MCLPNGWPHRVSSILLATSGRALSEYLGVWCFAQKHLDGALKVCWQLSCYLHNCYKLVLAKILNLLFFLFLISSLLIQKTNRKHQNHNKPELILAPNWSVI